MVNRIGWNILSCFFPWIVLLIYDNPGGAIIALVMQATIIGWIPAAMWAFRTRAENKAAEHKKKS